MNKLTTGSFINKLRAEQRVSKTMLSDGLCAYQLLQKIEKDQAECSLELFTMLLQRLGKSSDKLEYILSWREYRLQCIRDWFMVCVFKGNRKWSERTLRLYEQKSEKTGTVQQMHLCRGRALISYRLGHDAVLAEEWLKKALDATFCHWREPCWVGYRISVFELENVLALVRMYQEQGKRGRELLVLCDRYIQQYITDGEEHAKIYSKYAWLAAEDCRRDGHIGQALALCTEALEELRQFSIEYFMSPLLEKMLVCYKEMRAKWAERGVSAVDEADSGWLSEERCRIYLEEIRHMRKQFGEPWYPEDSILWNCCCKMYHLDYEILGAERRAQGMTQDRAVDGVYLNAKEIGKIERDKQAPTRKNFLLLMRKFGMERERKASLVFSESFEVLELRRRMQGCSSRRQYDRLEELLAELKQKLDLRILENWWTVRFYRNTLDMVREKRPFDELLAEDFEMLQETYHLTPEEIENQTKLPAVPRKGERGRPRKKPEQKGEVYRAPLKNEADILNQAAILLKKAGKSEEALRLYEGVLRTFEHSRVRPEYRLSSYGLLLGNMAGDKESIKDAQKAIRLSLRCGKLSNLADNYLTIACAMLDDSTNRELCRQMIQETYYLFELSKNTHNRDIVRKYYKHVFERDIEKD